MITLHPAYGRTYSRKLDAQVDLDADRDFIESVSGKPINRPQLAEMGYSRVLLRYGCEGRKLTTLVVLSERRDPPEKPGQKTSKLTMRRFRQLARDYGGYCATCKATRPSAGIEPDVTDAVCSRCRRPTVCGIEHAVLAGLLEVCE